MYKNESGYTHNADDIIRKFGMVIPFIVVTYGIFIQLGWISSSNNSGAFTFILITIGWLILGVIQFLTPSSSALSSTIRLGADHLLAGLSCIFITNSVLVLWPILMMATYIFFGRVGIKYNVLAYFAITVIEVLIHITDLPYIIVTIVTFITVSLTAYSLISISRTHEIKQEKLFQSQLKESAERDRMAAIVNNLTDAVISIDPAGKIKVYNSASLSLLDTNRTLKGHSVNKILSFTDIEDNPINIFEELKTIKSAVHREDLYHKYQNGDRIRLSVTYTPIRKGYSNTKKSEIHDGYIIIMRDITKIKSLEEERDEFISVASHELRTPIAIAEGSISNVIVMMSHPKVSADMLKNAIKVAHDQVVFLASMVNDLSSLSRAESGQGNGPELLDVNELGHNLLNKYISEATTKKLKINLDISPNISKIMASKLYVEELLQNFMTNALKYTQKGTIDIIIKQQSNMITFSVKDTGIGISKSDQAKIFTKFYRSEDYRTRETGGTGLGLYIAMKLARQIGTEIKISSRLNFGSTFSFSIPIKKNDVGTTNIAIDENVSKI